MNKVALTKIRRSTFAYLSLRVLKWLVGWTATTGFTGQMDWSGVKGRLVSWTGGTGYLDWSPGLVAWTGLPKLLYLTEQTELAAGPLYWSGLVWSGLVRSGQVNIS